MSIVALGPVRHACHACGSCCTGWRVKVAANEVERIERHAASLDVETPLVDGMLRTVDGACVFLGADRLCRIHAAFGENEKPVVCRAFPRLAVRTEQHVRAGADPGCSSTWQTFRDGPELEFPEFTTRREQHLPAELIADEHSLIELARTPHMTLAQLAGIVAEQPGHAPRLPPYLTKRFLGAMKPLEGYLTHADAGPLLRAHLADATEFLRTVDAAKPPRLLFAQHQSDLFLETLQRTLFLRIGDAELPPLGKFVVLLAGSILCGYVYQRPDDFGRGLAAWSRISRLPGFWMPFIPNTAAARRLMTG